MNFCVKVHPPMDTAECIPFASSTLVFGHLESRTPYNFSVFTYINTSDGKQLLSGSACSSVVSTCKYINSFIIKLNRQS